MTSAIGKVLDPIGAMTTHKAAYDGAKEADKAADAPAAAAPAAAASASASALGNSADAAEREQSDGQRASAAGPQRSDNEADVLGYARPKKRSASRAILG